MKAITLMLFVLCAFIGRAQDYTQVYIIGGATANGWDNGKAQKMIPVDGKDAVFAWTGHLSASDFKLINHLGTFMPAFNATSENEKIILGKEHDIVFNSEDAKDFKFVMNKAGLYTVIVDLKNLKLMVKDAEKVNISLWAIGSAVPNGAIKLASDGDGEGYIFNYSGALNQGVVKFATSETATADTKYYVPVEEDIDIQDASTMLETVDANAAGWNVGVASKYYKMKINVINKQIEAEIYRAPENLYMIGGATEAGWDVAKAVPFTKDDVDPNMFVFNGELKVRTENVESNLFKILGQQDWGPYSLHPLTAQEPVLTSTTFVVSEGDEKWSISDDKQGFYKIEINTFDETFSATYLGSSSVESNIADKGIEMALKDGAICITSHGKEIDAMVFNAAGTLVDEACSTSLLTLGHNLSSGIYIVKATTSDCQKTTMFVLR